MFRTALASHKIVVQVPAVILIDSYVSSKVPRLERAAIARYVIDFVRMLRDDCSMSGPGS